MNKLYSKSFLIVKAVFCVGLSPLYMIISSLLTVEDNFLYIIISAVPIGCLYTIPFWLSISYMRKFRVSGIAKYILYDAVYCLAPATLGVLFSEIVYSIVEKSFIASGIVTLIFSAIFILVSLIFWLFYRIFSHK